VNTSKSPRRVLRVAYEAARQALPAYSHLFSPRKYTQHQLFACLVLKEFLRTDYRGLAAHLADHPELARSIGLGEELPHFTTYQKAADRLLMAATARKLFDAVLEAAVKVKARKRRVPLAAVDGTGLESRHVSRYYVKRRSNTGSETQETTYAKYPKVVLVTDCHSPMVLAAVPGRGPASDLVHFKASVASGGREGADRDPLGRRRLRWRVGPRACPVLRHPLGDPRGAGPTVGEAAGREVAAADEATAGQAEVWATVASRDGQQHDQAATGLRASGAELLEPMPRDHPADHHT
jgi:hypothetical protein